MRLEPYIRHNLIKALNQARMIILASVRKLMDAIDFIIIRSASICSTLVVIHDGGPEENKCANIIKRRARKEGLNVYIHGKYTPALMLADYIAGIARNLVLIKLQPPQGKKTPHKYNTYIGAYKRLYKLKGKVHEFL
ncbi:hypothetical protein PYJP_11030 [Pyrofollis japonicus]|nr:hypothetical protein PYJP_11030 [Pyrofollis japonicus]